MLDQLGARTQRKAERRLRPPQRGAPSWPRRERRSRRTPGARDGIAGAKAPGRAAPAAPRGVDGVQLFRASTAAAEAKALRAAQRCSMRYGPSATSAPLSPVPVRECVYCYFKSSHGSATSTATSRRSPTARFLHDRQGCAGRCAASQGTERPATRLRPAGIRRAPAHWSQSRSASSGGSACSSTASAGPPPRAKTANAC